MKTRHTNELLARLELVADLGTAVIRKEELKLWYGVERIGRTVYADLHEKWTGELEYDQPLMVGKTAGEFVFIWAQGLTANSDAWFQDVATLAKKKGSEPEAEVDTND